MVASSSLLLALLPTASALQMALKPAVKPRCAAPAMQYGQPQYGQQQGYGAPQQGYGQQQGYGGGMQQGGYGQQAMGIRIVPTSGIYPDSEYAVALGGQQVLGRRNTWSDKLTISREQCGIQVGMDGSIMLVSLGRPRTGWRNPNGGWNPIGGQYVQESVMLQIGDQICLDERNPEWAVYTIMQDTGVPYVTPPQQQGGYGQQQGYGQQGGYGQQQGYGGQQGGYGGQQGGYGGQQGGYGGQQGGYGNGRY